MDAGKRDDLDIYAVNVQSLNSACMFPAWREESCSAESKPEETRPSLRKVRTDGGVDDAKQNGMLDVQKVPLFKEHCWEEIVEITREESTKKGFRIICFQSQFYLKLLLCNIFFWFETVFSSFLPRGI